jgi:hypothetical protein
MAHQIGLFCIPQLADARCLEADQNGGSARGYQAIFVPSTALAGPGCDGSGTITLS